MKASLKALIPALALVWPSLGCSDGRIVDLGNDNPPAESELAIFSGSWDGHTQGFEFPSGSDRVRFTLSADGQGALELGDVDLPPPSDPKKGYPPIDSTDMWDPPPYHEGFPYPLHEVHRVERRVHAALERNEVYSAWCQMQTPTLDPDPDAPDVTSYGCHSGEVSVGDGGCIVGQSTEVVDCQWAYNCGPLCICAATGCDHRPTRDSLPLDLGVTLSADGEELEGALVGLVDYGVETSFKLDRQ